jgi:hypothetical protein
MEAPKLPRAVLPSKTVNNSSTPRMFGDEIRTIVDGIVYYDPDAVEALLGRTDNCGWNEGKLIVFKLGWLDRM